MKGHTSISAGLLLFLSASLSTATATANDGPPDQSRYCVATEIAQDSVAMSCTPGQKVLFLPQRFGNPQMPVMFAAVHCDLRYAIALTEGAVTCIYRPVAEHE